MTKFEPHQANQIDLKVKPETIKAYQPKKKPPKENNPLYKSGLLQRYATFKGEKCNNCQGTDFTYKKEAGNLAILLAIFCFPCGLLACVSCKDKVAICSNCNKEVWRRQYLKVKKEEEVKFNS